MNDTYSKKAVNKVVDALMEIICDQDEEIRILRAQRPTPRYDVLKERVDRLLSLANGGYVTTDDIFAIFGGRNES